MLRCSFTLTSSTNNNLLYCQQQHALTASCFCLNVTNKLVNDMKDLCISQFQVRPAPPPPPGLLRGICPSCQSQEWGICKFCAARGPGICQPRGHSWAFDTQAVSYQKITTQRILLGKKADWLICQGQEKLKRFKKACSWFYACTSSLLIEPELHSEIGSYRRESTFFGYWIKFLLRLFEKHRFIFNI